MPPCCGPLDPSGVSAAPSGAVTEVALTRLLDTGWRVAARYPFLWHLPSVSASQDRNRHGPVLDQMLAIIERGQETGDFDRALSPN